MMVGMIDLESGEFALPAIGGSVGPSLCRTDFLASPIEHSVHVDNDPWVSYRLPPQDLGGASFSVVLYFHEDRLDAVELSHSSDAYGQSWESWSEGKELQRKEFHDSWLSRQNIALRSYGWGTVDSVYDAKSGASVIVLRYQ